MDVLEGLEAGKEGGMTTTEDFAPVERVTTGELRAALDALARERVGLSAEEFIAALKAGELDPYSPTVSRLAILARLIR
jgi:hypothetical protein